LKWSILLAIGRETIAIQTISVSLSELAMAPSYAKSH
jgi:hypothetical protein